MSWRGASLGESRMGTKPGLWRGLCEQLRFQALGFVLVSKLQNWDEHPKKWLNLASFKGSSNSDDFMSTSLSINMDSESSFAMVTWWFIEPTHQNLPYKLLLEFDLPVFCSFVCLLCYFFIWINSQHWDYWIKVHILLMAFLPIQSALLKDGKYLICCQHWMSIPVSHNLVQFLLII